MIDRTDLLSTHQLFWMIAVLLLFCLPYRDASIPNNLYSIGYIEHDNSTTLPSLVRTANSDQRSFFFLYRRERRLIPDIGTLNTLLGHPYNPEQDHNIVTFLMEIDKYTLGPPMPSIIRTAENVDEYMRVEILFSSIFYGHNILNEFDHKLYIGKYINPSLVFFQNRLLLATGLAWNIYGLHDGLLADEQVHFKWYYHENYSRFDNSENATYLGIGNSLPKTPFRIVGQDPRMVYMQETNRIFVIYTNRFVPKMVRLGFAELGINETSGEMAALVNCHTIPYGVHIDQKNWSPFIYNTSNIYLVQSINPLHILALNRTACKEETVSKGPLAKLRWEHGHLRGGTNAVFIESHQKYISFFHSAGILPGCKLCYMKTYTMGVYTFSAHPPFQLLEISPMPIMPEEFYTNTWAPFKNRGADYVVFPSTINLLPEDRNTLLLSMGTQDQYSWLIKFNLTELLQTLIPVHHNTEDEIPARARKKRW